MDDQNIPRVLDGLDDSRQALLDMLARMRHGLYWYTPQLCPGLYDCPEILDALRGRIVNQPKLRFHMVLPPAREWREHCPRLAQLSARLMTALKLRTLDRESIPDRPELSQAFVVADGRLLLHFSDPHRLLGRYEPKPVDRTKELSQLLQLIWDRAEPDPDLRYLGI
ncbi:MAG: hypothetical protein CSA09_02380 [Candidatus Contendobacter odensis]|uniref:DUF7931 domain-containing protein n=1 Tax=Candidatus Contendibacter odensensis TaxID=1400860 RepID=A0A2G6PFJ3_9GAMM|nr:MAG: hypothetical protein CSA09_02380 [Candidatus Contendobacter odensis]